MFSRGIVAAMEDEAQATELAIDETGADSMEADMVDVVDMSADIESGTDDMAQTVADADQLERHVEVLTDAEGEGGASPELIEATEIAVEGIYARLGIYGSTGIPALEAFSTKTGRARATRVAIEGIGETIKKIWEAVKMAFTKLVNFVKDFFGRLFDANKKMLARVNSLRAKAKDLKGAPSGKVKASGIAGVIPAGDIANAKKNLGVGQIATAIGDITNVAKSNNAAIEGAKSKEAFDKFSVVKSGKGASGVKAPDGFQWTELYKVGLNSVLVLESKGGASGQAAYEAASKFQAKVNKVEGKGGDGELVALTKEAGLTVLDAVEASVNELINTKVKVAEFNATLEKAIAAINGIASQASKEDEGSSERSTRARSAVTAVGNGGAKVVTLIGAETTRVCQAYLTYVERSFGAHSEEKKPAEKDAA